jgi:hypothetical protein
MQPLHSDCAAMKLLIYNVPMFVIPLTFKDERGGVECTFLCLKPELESTVSSTYGVIAARIGFLVLRLAWITYSGD